ncbi:hypothetical protein [Pseudoalteromonas phage J2-1_QLiu-2017]|nr:hypothetical protein [Pseudoalteromonas phage J2-1_QLiu-2017]
MNILNIIGWFLFIGGGLFAFFAMIFNIGAGEQKKLLKGIMECYKSSSYEEFGKDLDECMEVQEKAHQEIESVIISSVIVVLLSLLLIFAN